MTATDDLLPCPFCGSKFTQIRWIGLTSRDNGAFEAGYRGECCDCRALTAAFRDRDEAVEAWNMRADPAQAVEATLGPSCEPPIASHWDGDVLTLTIPCDPSSIHVQRAEGQPRKVYACESYIVAATLGRETCKLPETRIDHGSIEYNGTTEWRRCSECGEEVLAYPARFCPNCGREVENNG